MDGQSATKDGTSISCKDRGPRDGPALRCAAPRPPAGRPRGAQSCLRPPARQERDHEHGLPIDLLLTVHVAISLVAIAAGLLAMGALAAGRWRAGLQTVFLLTTLLTSVTGFLFPFTGVTPAFLFGVLSLVALAVAGIALARRSTSRAARGSPTRPARRLRSTSTSSCWWFRPSRSCRPCSRWHRHRQSCPSSQRNWLCLPSRC